MSDHLVPGGSAERRLQRELMLMTKDPPIGISMNPEIANGTDLTEWNVKLDGAHGTLYEGDIFNLKLKFGPNYPFDSPEVVFTGENIPIHPHVYSNGHICLSILGNDWSPALSSQAICLSIISMLSSCKEKVRPFDNDFYVKTCSTNPKNTKWFFHDDKV